MTVFRNTLIHSIAFALSAIVLFASLSAGVRAGERFVTIGSGDITGVYYPAGSVIAEMVNAKRAEHGVRATVESTRGSVFNLNAIAAGYLEFGLAQSDKQYQAVKGLNEWAQKGPQQELRSVFSLHHESVNLVAAVDSGIRALADLKGKRVNLGSPGSGQYQNALDALKAEGLNPNTDLTVEQFRIADAPRLLQDNRIDAFFCTLGHPNDTLTEAVSGPRKVRFIPITGLGIDSLISDRAYYIKTTIPVEKFYRGAEGSDRVDTFGVIATMNASSRVPDAVVYVIAKELFDNLDRFKTRHPAFAELSKQDMVRGLSAPIHPGAVKYFREKGLLP
jgi:hypothetical protein